jgi:hypothetical protein
MASMASMSLTSIALSFTDYLFFPVKSKLWEGKRRSVLTSNMKRINRKRLIQRQKMRRKQGVGENKSATARSPVAF